jgi:hypothetical protein
VKGILSGHEGGEARDSVYVDEAVADLGEFLSMLIFYSLEVGNESFERVDALHPISEMINVCG